MGDEGVAMSENPGSYIPALRFRRLTALYDPLLRLTMREATFKRRLFERAAIAPGERVLDLGAGTGTLTLMVKRVQPEADVVGLDGDEAVLAIARAKAAAAGLAVRFEHGLVGSLPYPDGSFDRILSSLLFHHLSRQEKERALDEAFRVLRPGGELHVADWGKPANPLLRVLFVLVQLLDGFATTADNARGLLPDLIAAAGFTDVRQTGHIPTVFGSLVLLRAAKPR